MLGVVAGVPDRAAVRFALCASSSVRTLVSRGVFGAFECIARERGLID